MLDDLLDDLAGRRRRRRRAGSASSATAGRRESHDARDFLARNQVPYRWLDVERDERGRRLLAAADGDAPLPLVLFPRRDGLSRPTTAQLAERTGLPRARRAAASTTW